MNKIKELLWTRPNEWFDKKDSDFIWAFIVPLAPTLLADEYFEDAAFRVFITWALCFGFYRLIWNQFNSTRDEVEPSQEKRYDFTPIFFKSATRQDLFDALESAKLSRQLSAAKGDSEEFEHWEVVILDIENLIENYSE
jgi:hypothetical protein